MYSCEITLELNDEIEADVTVYFSVDSPGYPEDRFDPAELPEFYIESWDIDRIYGEGYTKNFYELLDGGWLHTANRAAEKALEDYDELYEHQYDAYCEVEG